MKKLIPKSLNWFKMKDETMDETNMFHDDDTNIILSEPIFWFLQA